MPRSIVPVLLGFAILLRLASASTAFAGPCPWDGEAFQGRIAYSADGNHNDPDDWAASPIALAILAQAGVKDRLVHFHFNSILLKSDPRWEATHAESVLGAARQYGYDLSRFFDCQRDLEAAIDSLVRAINDSRANSPLYFIIAGPVEVPLKAIQRADPAKRQFVYCISHSQWNDGFARDYAFTNTKRDLLPLGIHWVQIPDQNQSLAFGRYGQPAQPEEFAPYFWLRDAEDPRLRFLWQRMLVSTRPDPSDAGMAWFLVTGDPTAEVTGVRQLLEHGNLPTINCPRPEIRLEAENFVVLDGYELEYRRDRKASHKTNVKLSGGTGGRIETLFNVPYAAAAGIYDVEIRALDEETPFRITLFVNGTECGPAQISAGKGRGWASHIVSGVAIRDGDSLAVQVQADTETPARLDYVQLRLHRSPATTSDR